MAMPIKLFLLFLALGACAGPQSEAPAGAPTGAPTGSGGAAVSVDAHRVYLVRHAEKAWGPNPPLSEAGRARAATLAEVMADKGLTHLHSTDYKRTRETAAPVAAQTGLPVLIYDATSLDAFAAELRATPGVHLVIGHSNTTPQLASALGGAPGAPINEKREYDRLYVVTLGAGGESAVESVIERFGVRYTE